MGQKYLVAGSAFNGLLGRRTRGECKAPTAREYETVGYCTSAAQGSIGKDKRTKAGGFSWLVPAGAMHQYTIIEPFTAVETGAPSGYPRS